MSSFLISEREDTIVKAQSIYISELLTQQELLDISEGNGTGIELIRFSIASELDRVGDAIAEVESAFLSRPNPPHLTLHGPYMDLNPSTWDSQVRLATMLRYSQAYAAAQALGAEKLVLHTGFIPHANFLEGWPPRVADFFLEWLDGRSGVTIALENVFDPIWEPLLEVWRQVNRPDFTLCLDVGHAHCYAAQPVSEWAERLLPALGHVHFHDNHGPRPFPHTPDEHLALGNGTLPVRALLRILSEKPDLTCAIECSRKEDVMRSLEALLA